MARTELTELFDRTHQRSVPIWLPLAVVALIIARVISMRVPVKSTQDLVRWVPIRQARFVSAAKHKPILYEFSADWCGPCRSLEEGVFFDQEMAATINDRFVPVKVVDRAREEGRNAPEVEGLQKQFGVRAFPTVVVAEPDGRELRKTVGYQGTQQFAAFLNGAR
jgi:thiol:disulfide interchange protein